MRKNYSAIIFVVSLLLSLNAISYLNSKNSTGHFYQYNILENFIPSIQNNTISEFDYEYSFNDTYFSNKFNISKNNLTAFPYISGNTLKGLADYVILNEGYINRFDPKAVKCGEIIFIDKSNILVENFMRKHHYAIANPYILITYIKIYRLRIFNRFLNDSKILAWFTTHRNIDHPKLIPIPLGIANEQTDGLINEHGNFQLVNNASQYLKPFNERKTLIYLNFIIKNNRPSRTQALNYFRKTFGANKNVIFVESAFYPKIARTTNFQTYLAHTNDSQFVVSPPGFGLDCYRTWEALIMGAVPIVQRSLLQPIYNGMPIMVVDNWSDVTEESLRQFKSKLNLSSDGIISRSKIWIRYWIEEIYRIKNKCAWF